MQVLLALMVEEPGSPSFCVKLVFLCHLTHALKWKSYTLHFFFRPMRINEVKWQVDSLVSEVEGTAQILHSTLSLYFDSHTVGEYLEQKIYGMWKEVTELRDGLSAIAERDTWHKRPIAPSPEVQKFLQRIVHP